MGRTTIVNSSTEVNQTQHTTPPENAKNNCTGLAGQPSTLITGEKKEALAPKPWFFIRFFLWLFGSFIPKPDESEELQKLRAELQTLKAQSQQELELTSEVETLKGENARLTSLLKQARRNSVQLQISNAALLGQEGAKADKAKEALSQSNASVEHATKVLQAAIDDNGQLKTEIADLHMKYRDLMIQKEVALAELDELKKEGKKNF